ncbi:MAG: hypothetical protein JXJ17_11325 [Anaerolineae bacterium]|nr:hypothetical protein [Anaerolineae bacterium]
MVKAIQNNRKNNRQFPRTNRWGLPVFFTLITFSLLATACRKAEPSEEPYYPTTPGVHLLLDDGRNAWPVDTWDEHLQVARQAVGEWGFAIGLVRLNDLDPDRWQIFMDHCMTYKLTPILRLATTYDTDHLWWDAPPADADNSYRSTAAQYAAFVASLDWPTNRHYVIIGNEPNHGDEWGGTPDPRAYARFLIDVAGELKNRDQQVVILNAGFDPYAPNTNGLPLENGVSYLDEETFLDQMVDAYPDVFDPVDIWASHSYPIGFSAGPWEQVYQIDRINGAVNPDSVSPPPGIFNRGINGYEWELYKLSTYSVDPLPVLITETGWRHSKSVNTGSLDGGSSYPDSELAAAYLDLALRGNNGRYPELPEDGWTPWLNDTRLVGVVIFALDGDPAEWGHTNLLKLDSSGVVTGTYPAFDILAAIHQNE